MRVTPFRVISSRTLSAALILLLGAATAHAQDAVGSDAPSRPATPAAESSELHAVTQALRDLQAQVQLLTRRVDELKAEELRAHAEARELSRQLALTRAQISGSHPSDAQTSGTQLVALSQAAAYPGMPAQTPAAATASSAAPQYLAAGTSTAPEAADVNERLSRLEENQQFLDDKLSEQNQSKVESGSKYRMRLSGFLLMNLFANRGNVDNLDIPQVANEQQAIESRGSFAGSLRQSQIGLQVFGPDVAGAHTSADVRFDFAGGFSSTENGVMMGLVRLRTGTIRFDWTNTSVIAGQDGLFFAPLAPTSIATIAMPALSYAGNLWSWMPQVRVEHRIHFSDASHLTIQGGILDSWSGDVPPTQFYRYETWGESSAQPAYAARVAWSSQLAGREFTLGAGGYYGRQFWALDRHVDGWAGTADLTLPLGRLFTLTSQFYRGRAVAGLSGGLGQDVIVPGPFLSPATPILGLDSIGGWAQLKYKPAVRFEINGAFGQDNPYAGELRHTLFSPPNYDSPLARNQSALLNFIYQPRSDLLFSVEYRHLHTLELKGDSYRANLVNLSVGYVF